MSTTSKLKSSDYLYGFHKPERYLYKSEKGLTEQVVKQISGYKSEPDWMREYRLESLKIFQSKPLPRWGGDLSTLNFDDIYYYIKPTDRKAKTWNELPEEIRDTYNRIGIPEAEKKYLGGVSAQYESEVVYKSIQKSLTKKGVIFLDMDSGLRQYPDLVRQYFGTIVPPADNKFSALNTAVWSGGSFIYVPKGVHVDLPLQAYFRINAANMGQFERTLIIAEEGSFVHYVEGCFIKGARVRTDKGEKEIENINVDDRVLTHNGRYRRVYHTMTRKYNGKLFSIRYYGDSGAKLQVTSEHPLLVCKREKKEYKNNNFQPRWLKADQLEVGDYLVYPIQRKEAEENITESKTERKTTSEDVFPRIYHYQPQMHLTVPFGYGRHKSKKTIDLSLDPDFYRLIGYFFSEGHIDKEHYLTFTFNSNETELIKDVKNLLKKYFDKDPITGKIRNHGRTIILCSTLAARLFAREFGSTNRSKHIPSWIIESPHRHLQELIRGMWYGDGSVDRKIHLFRYSSVSRSLVLGFRDVLLKLGIIASINSQIRKYPKQIMHNVIISRPSNKLFSRISKVKIPDGRKMGSPTYIDNRYLYIPIKSIIPKNISTDVYNFSVEEDESYVAEGVVSHNCTAPIYTTDSLHSAVVEIIVKKGARVRYTTIQNWSTNVYNLVTKRMRVEEEGVGEWIDGNLGSKLTMKYPSVYLVGEGARGEILSIAYAGSGQHQDAGGKAIHIAPHTTSKITSKSVSAGGGRTSYRGLIQILPSARDAKSKVVCDALLIDEASRSDTYPTMDIRHSDVQVEHEATVSKIGDEQLFYLMSRGLKKADAEAMIVNGFIEPIVKELPLEYAVELNRLIQLEMEGSVG